MRVESTPQADEARLRPTVPRRGHGRAARLVLRHGLTWVAIFGVITLMLLRLPPIVARQDVVVNTYGPLVEVDAIAKQQFVEPIDDTRLVDGAIRGMMLQLDPYSGYVAPDELASFKRRSAGDYDGVGLELGVRDGKITVIAPVEDSPASKAGLLAGDRLHAIDGRDTKGMSVFEAEDRLVGDRGSEVTLVVGRGLRDDPIVFHVIRGPVSIRSVRGFSRRDDGTWDYRVAPYPDLGYIRVSNFKENTLRELDEAIAELGRAEVSGIMLDLRFNPGGLMDVAIEMVDRFLDEGLILSTVTRRRVVHEYRAHPGGRQWDGSLVVLVNGGSASSSEIVAGSLQDHRRALLIGERTFGKGSVQHLMFLSEHEAAIKLTVAYYRLPSGRIIHRTTRNQMRENWGVRPDVEVVLSTDEVQAVQASRRSLDRTANGSEDELPSTLRGDACFGKEVLRDRQLEEAIRQLRTMIDSPVATATGG